jgi:hypothetical protein
VVFAHHIDEVRHHNAAQIAQPQLTRNRMGRLQIGLENRIVKIACPDKAAGIHVNRGQRLGLVNHQVTARFKSTRRARARAMSSSMPNKSRLVARLCSAATSPQLSA